MMHLIMPVSSTGFHLAGWRHPDAWSDTVFNTGQAIELAQLAERGKFDLLFLADINAVSHMDMPELFAYHAPTSRSGGPEPFTLLSALAAVTSRIGLVCTGSTTYDEPYFLARRVASMDHISGGRAGWNVVTGAFPEEGLNFNRNRHMPKAERYDRAREFVEVVLGLWDSWAGDAFVEDKASGHYLRPERVHVLDHQGAHFQVRGPLNVARSPQGRPVVFHAGQSEQGRDLAAFAADCVFASAPTKEAGIALRDDLRRRTEAYGRSPDAIRILPGLTTYVGRTVEEAREQLEQLNALITPAVGVENLSKILDYDLTSYPVDGPMPEISGEVDGIDGKRAIVSAWVREEGLTVRQTYERFIASIGSKVVLGTAPDIADEIEDWYCSGACDGFLISPSIMPTGLSDFVEFVIPELQRRGIFRTKYEGRNLREIMGLPTPTNQYFRD
jgi:FMN-dependent oxidoreductase (nitrilotriacetate monooxygenase family)